MHTEQAKCPKSERIGRPQAEVNTADTLAIWERTEDDHLTSICTGLALCKQKPPDK